MNCSITRDLVLTFGKMVKLSAMKHTRMWQLLNKHSCGTNFKALPITLTYFPLKFTNKPNLRSHSASFRWKQVAHSQGKFVDLFSHWWLPKPICCLHIWCQMFRIYCYVSNLNGQINNLLTFWHVFNIYKWQVQLFAK